MKTARAQYGPAESKLSVKRGLSRRVLPALVALLPAVAYGIGLRTPNQDPEAVARGNAFVATADNPSAIYYNPAGITQLEGHNLSVGVLNYFFVRTHYESPGGTSSNAKFEVIPTPQLHYVWSPKDCAFSFGAGIYAPFGLATSWPEDTGFRSLAIKARLTYLTLNPVIAWKAHRSFSLAIGPTINYSELMFTRGLAPGFGPPDRFKFKGDDSSFGFNAGLLWRPHEQWSVGAQYRSASTMDYDGTSTYNSTALNSSARTKARAPSPQIVSAGVSFRPTPNWNLEFDADYADWSTLKTVTLEGTKNLGLGSALGLPDSDLPLPLDWHGSWIYEFGVTRRLNHGWFISAGYSYSGETTPSQTYSPAVPDTELHIGSLGFGHAGERWRWAVAAQIIAGPARKITDSQPNPLSGESANGSYQLLVPTLSVSVGYRF
jgi:long-chain fatty acid transport protein